MMWTGTWNIVRKELVDTCRDRKTLIFMLLISTLAIPLLMLGINRLIVNIEKKQAIQVVRIAATAETQRAYVKMVHDWFLASEVATGLQAARSPIVRALVKPEVLDELEAIPPEILTDPVVFERWTRDMVGNVRKGLDGVVGQAEDPVPELPRELRGQLMDYYRVSFKGLGLVEFVDPATLPAPMSGEGDSLLPEDLRQLPHAAQIAGAIKAKTIQGYLDISAGSTDFENREQESVPIVFLHDSTIPASKEAFQRIRFVIRNAGDTIVHDRLVARHLSDAFLEPVYVREDNDLASDSEIVLANIGGILPYIIILFAFLGGMYPAIDLGAGEKERNTLETLILSPTSRTEIALGKFLVILTAALIAAFLGVASIALSAKYIVLPPEIMEKFNFRISPGTVMLVALLSIPPAAAFSGMFLAISIYARSFKEAQNYIAPLQFVIILPAMAAMIPGLEMSWKMACIPLVNVSLLSRDFLKGDTDWMLYGVTLMSCLALAGACIWFAVRQFQKEEVLFRS